MNFLHNHVGYHPAALKRAWLQHDAPLAPRAFTVADAATQQVVFSGLTQASVAVPGWQGRHFACADFSALSAPGRYVLLLDGTWPPVASPAFDIGADLFGPQMLSDIVHYFKGQRCSGLFDIADRAAPLLDTRAPRDVHGGWYDASGDASKYLSHLSYANFMNPQQTPLVAWTLLDARLRLPAQSVWFDERLVDEALHGADFLARMQDEAGFFYMTVFDKWSKDPAQREICAYATQKGHKSADYAAGWRQGGGLAIAALARAAALPRDGEGEFSRAHYLAAARRGHAWLQAHSLSCLDDGVENLIDDYCALLAAAELFAATGEAVYRDAAEARVQALLAQQDAAGWYWCDRARTRSYFHASDAGLPHLALARWLEVAHARGAPTAQAPAMRAALERSLRHELTITHGAAAGPNPLGYPRQHVVMPGRPADDRFFVPHANESGYWWQGENARLASLAAAARAAQSLHLADAAFDAALARHAQTLVDWILGANPFDTCMLQGWGHHPARYEPGFWNACGGVCNGITAGLEDENDIDFRKPENTVPTHSWRWTEQWLPHAAWLLAALAWGQTTPQLPHPSAPGGSP